MRLLKHEINKLESEIAQLEKQLNRAKELYQLLDRDLPQADVDSAISWYYHSNLSPAEIYQKVVNNEG